MLPCVFLYRLCFSTLDILAYFPFLKKEIRLMTSLCVCLHAHTLLCLYEYVYLFRETQAEQGSHMLMKIVSLLKVL
jgi:hypothetical protein